MLDLIHGPLKCGELWWPTNVMICENVLRNTYGGRRGGSGAWTAGDDAIVANDRLLGVSRGTSGEKRGTRGESERGQ